jgi:hypothetical protein
VEKSVEIGLVALIKNLSVCAFLMRVMVAVLADKALCDSDRPFSLQLYEHIT